jgi:2Fe-2S ferredoxin
MPQIGEIEPGVWVASGFGRHGLNTTALAGELIARGIVEKDQTWRLFAPYELVWAGGKFFRVVAQAIYTTSRPAINMREALARGRERRRKRRQARAAARQAALAAKNVAHPEVTGKPVPAAKPQLTKPPRGRNAAAEMLPEPVLLPEGKDDKL